MINVQSITIHDFTIGINNYCLAGNMPCAIGYKKNTDIKLIEELKQIIVSWNINHLYKEVYFDGNERLFDHQDYIEYDK